MELNVEHEVAVLQRTATGELKAKFTELSGDATNTRNRTWLIRRIAWLLQAKVAGGLSQRALERAEELASEADLRATAPRQRAATQPQPTIVAPIPHETDQRLPMPGAFLSRPYKGQTFRVQVLAEGFEFEGQVYKSLSAVAKQITGSHCNGYHFFKLAKGAKS